MSGARYLETLNPEQRRAVEHGVAGKGANIAGPLLVIAGAYFTWYGIYELRIRDDPLTEDGPVGTVTGWSSDISNWVQDIGAERLGLTLGIVVCVALLYVLLRPPSDPAEEPDEAVRAG